MFLYGAAPGRAAKAAAALEARYPGVKVVGTIDGCTRVSVLEAVNEACADVLLVGLGQPTQERWIDENRALLDVGVVAGVGALFEVLSGEREPRRPFARHLLGCLSFVVRMLVYLGLGLGPCGAVGRASGA